MPDFLKIVLAVLGISAFPAVSHAAPAKPPNVLFILVDDMGWGDPSCYGGIGVTTPAMDGLAMDGLAMDGPAMDGLRFTRFYTASPICSASRCGFIVDRFPARSHITSVLHERAANRQKYPERAISMARTSPPIRPTRRNRGPKPSSGEYGRNPKSFSFPAKPAAKSPNVAKFKGNWKLM